MVKTRRTQKFALVFILLVAMVTAACGTSSNDATNIPGTLPTGEIPQGGELVIGAAQEPECLDYLNFCSISVWGLFTAGVNTLPRPYAVERVFDGNEGTDNWEWAPTELLVGEAELDTGDPQTITYTINPDAVWDDGTPITGDDFIYTWKQIVDGGEDIFDPTGYDIIADITQEDEGKTVTVEMSEPFVQWRNLFGASYGLLPAHILEGQDRNAVMADGYDFSGGPFKIESWDKEESLVLVRNDNYWGDKANLDKVTFVFQEDSTAQFTAFRNNEVSVIYPDAQVDVVDEITSGDLGDFERYVNINTANTEALWFNNAQAPLDSKNVRQALSYSIDRDAIVDTLFGDIGVSSALNSIVPPVLSKFAAPEAFEEYSKNVSRADELLIDDGWKKNSDDIYEKDGEELAVEIKTTEGDDRRRLLSENIQSQLNDAGWKVTLTSLASGPFFGSIGEGDFQVALFSNVVVGLEPGNCFLFCGGSPFGVTNDELDELLFQVEGEFDEDARIEANQKAERLIAENAYSLPLNPQPNILLWKTNVVGEVDDNPFQGPFWQLNNWGVTS